MKDRIAHVWSSHTGADGEARWPKDREARDELASRLLGACAVAEMDESIALALDVLQNRVASAERRRSRPDAGGDDLRRQVLASLTQEQRKHVEELLFSTLRLAMFGLLTKLDQFPGGAADLVVRDPDTGRELASVVDGSVLDLHDRLGSWLEEFSEYPDRFWKEHTGRSNNAMQLTRGGWSRMEASWSARSS